MALWDLFAQRAGVSLQALLGGRGDRVHVGVSVGIQSTPEKLLEVVNGYLADGYRRIKLKIKPGRDVGDVAIIRQHHPDLLLQADGNSVYRLGDADHLRALDGYNLLLLEQPLGMDDIIDHAKLQPQLKTPVCLDESIHSVEHARWALELGACRIINIKPGRVGGMHEAKRIHDYCRARGVPVWMGGMLETGIGRAANVAVASLPGFTLPGDISASRRYYFEDIVEQPFELNPDSTLSVPQGPGLGVKVSEAALQKVTQREEVQRN
jgi:O-succinylbenzoate synthase